MVVQMCTNRKTALIRGPALTGLHHKHNIQVYCTASVVVAILAPSFSMELSIKVNKLNKRF